MELARLIRFLFLGSKDLEPYAILLVRVALGLFFAISPGETSFLLPDELRPCTRLWSRPRSHSRA
jgi:hypothetical protein